MLFSKFEIFWTKAVINFFACSGDKTIRDNTLAFEKPGIIAAKSKTNSVGEWLIIPKLEYIPLATSSFTSIFIFFWTFFSFLLEIIKF